MEGLDVAASARKHGLTDEDIRHAARMALREISQGDRVLLIGSDRAGRLLEVVVIDPDDEPTAIHAMPLRRKFLDLW